jgi:hypothetical protein
MKWAIVAAVAASVVVSALLAATQSGQEQPGQKVASQPGKNRDSSQSVFDAGAVGDGQADDTAAIQKLIDAKVGSIRFPAGKYRITRTLVVDLDKIGFTSFVADGTAVLVMAGPGPAIRFVGTHAGTAAPSSVKPEVWQRQRMPVVEGLAIQGEHAEADGIEARGTMQFTARGVHIRKCRHGIVLAQRNRNVLIDACHIYENSGCGVLYDRVDLHQSNISASHISYCDGGGVVVRGGNVRNIHIAGCDIEGNMAQDGPPTANVLLDCADGSVAEVAITGCTIQHTKEAPQSANIRILGRGFMQRRGQNMPFQCGNVTIGDNVLSDVQVNIHLAGVRGATIVGNTFWQGYAHNLLLEDCTGIAIGPNMLERNPLYAYTSLGSDSVVLRGCSDCTLTGLHLHNVINSPAGLILEKCDRLHVTGCTILDCDNAGLLVKDCTRSTILNNVIRDDREGAKTIPIKVEGGSGNSVQEK